MDRLLNSFKGFSGEQDASIGQPRFATVTSVDPEQGTVRAQLQPEGVQTGWLPVMSQWVGNGWGLSCPPSPGDQVLVLTLEGDAENGVVVGRTWSRDDGIPQAPVGELWLTHQSGSSIRLVNNGTVAIKGDLHVAGDVFDQHGSVKQLRDHYNQHKHSVPQGGMTSLSDHQD